MVNYFWFAKVSCLTEDNEAYLICQSGARARKAAQRLSGSGLNLFIVDGGINAWTASGYPVLRGTQTVWSMERQVRLCAGLLVLTGLALGCSVNITWLGLSAFVAIGMIISAITNSCAMATLLQSMPWNRS